MTCLGRIAITLALAGAVRCQAASTDSFRYLRNIDRPDSRAEEILSLSLDSDVYAATQVGLADVRIIDAEGREVPYQLEKAVHSGATGMDDPLRNPFVIEMSDLLPEDEVFQQGGSEGIGFQGVLIV